MIGIRDDLVEAMSLPDDWLERDTWASWWAAHRAIGEQVREGLRELPEMFRPSRECDE
jgi:hypothetical protein